eukprot:scaffold6015_cov278-Chaetoceros_neogracile.AAC.12
MNSSNQGSHQRANKTISAYKADRKHEDTGIVSNVRTKHQQQRGTQTKIGRSMLNSARLLALFVIMISCTCFYMIMYSVDRTEKLIMMDSLLNLQSDAVIADGDTNIHIRDHHHEGVLLGHNEDTITGTTSILETQSTETNGIYVDNNQDSDPDPATDTTGNKTPEEYLLQLPFYIYEDFLHDANLLNFTAMHHKALKEQPAIGHIVANEANVTFEEYLNNNRFYKHSGDIHFVRSALEHPMRVLNPEEAKIFVVPSLITMDIADHFYHSKKDKLLSKLHLKRINTFLRDSPFFKRNDGADHIAPIAFMRGGTVVQRSAPLLARCNLVQFYEGPADQSYIHPEYRDKRAMYKIFKLGASPCNMTAFDKKTKNFAFIGALFRMRHGHNKHFQNRRDICKWLSYTNYTYDVCGHGDKCPNLSQAFLGFHARGDLISADRLFATMLSGTVPIFTLKPQYKSQPDWYDWDTISYFANVENKTTFFADIDKIMSNKTDIMVKTKNVLENRDLFDWHTNVPFDIYMCYTSAAAPN